jgi:ATP-dependent RNA helicase SUPV3L1/SUV3
MGKAVAADKKGAFHLMEEASSRAAKGKVTAVLGPTNTGKTYLAIERMLGHKSGMIGFPLRLLARENYDRIVKVKGPSAVALVTGEEKIVPKTARYFVCTVESMPLDRPVEFMAVDEIQLCADGERGHIFTDRLLNARGLSETMVLGSDTMTGLIRKLLPNTEFIQRPRFSRLTYAGHKKLTRLPRRSAIVAFSANDVYELAELVRRTRGGTAVVLGALSPRTRNAQVEMFQAGEVDYLVATDAIGMGLNMEIDHVAFAKLDKFDGVGPRKLRAGEIGQIAGRAGRHMADGTFGTTHEASELDEAMIDAVESHRFEAVTLAQWRNAALDMRSGELLLRSLEFHPDRPELRRARPADDQESLTALLRDADIAAKARGRAVTSLLWEVCQIPDFRKVMSDQHHRFQTQVFEFLSRGEEKLPQDWVAAQVEKLDTALGDIDALMARIAHVRTWTYVSHRAEWLDHAEEWQAKTRAIEDRLSDALHEKLTQRFVDRRASRIAQTLAQGDALLAGIKENGEVVVDGQPVGSLHGFRFTLEPSIQPGDAKAVLTAARRALKSEIEARLAALDAAESAHFRLGTDGAIVWHEAPIAKLVPGNDPLSPGLLVLDSPLLSSDEKERIRTRVAAFVSTHIAEKLKPLFAVQELQGLQAGGRGIAFHLRESLGLVTRASVRPLIESLTPEDRRLLARAGVRLAPRLVYLPALLKPAAAHLKALLWSLHHRRTGGWPHWDGRSSLPLDETVPPGLAAALGYIVLGPRLVRADVADRIEVQLMTTAKANDGLVADTLPLLSLLGCTREELPLIVRDFGFEKHALENGGEGLRQRGRQKPRPKRDASPPPPAAATEATENGEVTAPPPVAAPKKKPRRKPHRAPKPAPSPVPVDPNSPFAILRTLTFAKARR